MAVDNFPDPTQSSAVDLRPGGCLGRFALLSLLDQGTPDGLWLARDSNASKEVVLKVLHWNASADDIQGAAWLNAAQSATRVIHPHIVALLEAGFVAQQPYLLFERAPGRSLDTVGVQGGAMDPHEAVSLMMDVVDALAVAHNVGLVHGQLSTKRVLVDAAGRARVSEFAPTSALITAADDAAKAQDIAAVGRMLLELLTGQANVQDMQALPDSVDESLRTILLHALATDPDQRYPNARAFLTALDTWASPGRNGEDAANGASQSSTLAFLLRRMRHKSDFPALSDTVVRIQSMANSETESVGTVTNEILKDVALTNKLLRLVNSVHYARGSSISTVSRAVTLVGFNGIRNMALSLVLLEHMQDKAHAMQIKEEFLRSLMAGTIASELCPVLRDSEEAFIGALFQNLGRLLVQFYFPEEANQVRKMVQAARDPVGETAAARSVLGLSFEELGVGVAKAWGLPPSIQKCMRKPLGAPPTRTPTDASERNLWTSLAGNDIADTLLHCEATELEARLAVVHRKYAMSIGSTATELQVATHRARHKLIEIAAAMELRVPAGSSASRLLHAPDDGKHNELHGHIEDDALSQPKPTGTVARQSRAAAVETLVAGIQDITNAMVEEDFKLSDVLRMILETMLRAMEFDRIIFCMRDPKTDMLVGRFGLGQGVEAQVKVFRSHLKAETPDLFTVVCLNGADTLISDASEARIMHRLPDWYQQHIHAPTFLVLPLQVKGSPFGLIYADKTVRDSLQLDDKELALLRTLRNQAVMAIRQFS